MHHLSAANTQTEKTSIFLSCFPYSRFSGFKEAQLKKNAHRTHFFFLNRKSKRVEASPLLFDCDAHSKWLSLSMEFCSRMEIIVIG